MSLVTCEICECEVADETIRHIEVKGQVKKICDECVTSIKGII